jgi:hypothetical protein
MTEIRKFDEHVELLPARTLLTTWGGHGGDGGNGGDSGDATATGGAGGNGGGALNIALLNGNSVFGDGGDTTQYAHGGDGGDGGDAWAHTGDGGNGGGSGYSGWSWRG